MVSHAPITQFLKFSLVFHSVTIAATKPATAAIIKPIGFAAITAHKPTNAVLIAVSPVTNAPIIALLLIITKNVAIAVPIPAITGLFFQFFLYCIAIFNKPFKLIYQLV